MCIQRKVNHELSGLPSQAYCTHEWRHEELVSSRLEQDKTSTQLSNSCPQQRVQDQHYDSKILQGFQSFQNNTIMRYLLFLVALVGGHCSVAANICLPPMGSLIRQVAQNHDKLPSANAGIIAIAKSIQDDKLSSRHGHQQPQHHSFSSLPVYLTLMRGGHLHNDDFSASASLDGYGGESSDEDTYDDTEDEDDADINEAEEDDGTAMHQQRRNLQRDQRRPPPGPGRGDRQSSGPQPAPYIPRTKKKKKSNLATRFAKSSLSFSKKAVGTTVKTSGKAAFYLMRPKAISESEIWGLWRLDQQVGLKQSTANIELTRSGLVIVRAGDEIIWKAPFRFVTPTWPKMPRVEFEARAFQPNTKGGKPGKAWVMFYKGHLERKVADKSVIKMQGKLYEIERPKGMFGKELPVRYNKVGSFVGRRRIIIQEDDENEDEYDDYDDDEEENDGYGGENGDQEGDAEGDYDDDYEEEEL